MQRFASGIGLVPEQAWEDPDLPASPFGTDPETASIGFENGGAAGSASPLTWAQAQQVRLTQSLGGSRPVEQPRIVRERYQPTPPPAAPVELSAPADGATVTTATVDVTGTTTPGATVDVASTATDTRWRHPVVTVHADADGAFSATVPGAVRHLGDHRRGDDRQRRDRLRPAHRRLRLHHGTTVLDVTDPSGDDNGPGTFAYPTSDDFHAGAFDIERFQVIVSGDNAVLRLRTRDLSPTFGPTPSGAQLVDVFVHDPGAATTSTDSAVRESQLRDRRRLGVEQPDRGAGLRQPGLRRRRRAVAGHRVGDRPARRRATSRCSCRSPRSARPGPGWKFAVVLHGQDGFSADQARGFQPTPQDFQFGLCASSSVVSPICAHRPRHRAEGDGRDHPGRGRPVRRARPDAGPVRIEGVAVP